MAKPRRAKQSNTPQTFSEKIHKAKIVLIEISLFLLFLVELLRFLRHTAGL